MLNRGELSCCSRSLLSGCVQWAGFHSGSGELREGQPKAALSWQEGEVTCVLSDSSELDIIFSKRQPGSLLHQILGSEIQLALLRVCTPAPRLARSICLSTGAAGKTGPRRKTPSISFYFPLVIQQTSERGRKARPFLEDGGAKERCRGREEPPWRSRPPGEGCASAASSECVAALGPVTREAGRARAAARAVLRKFSRKQPRVVLSQGGVGGKQMQIPPRSQRQSIQMKARQQCVFISFLQTLPESHFAFQLLLTGRVTFLGVFPPATGTAASLLWPEYTEGYRALFFPKRKKASEQQNWLLGHGCKNETVNARAARLLQGSSGLGGRGWLKLHKQLPCTFLPSEVGGEELCF